jgi:hypothetical protein
MAAKVRILRRASLNDGELDAVLSAADKELLGYVHAAVDPEAAFLKIMAAGDGKSAPSDTFGAPLPSADSGISRRGCRRVVAAAYIAAAAAIAIFAILCHAPWPFTREGAAQSLQTPFKTTVFFVPNRYSITPTARTQLTTLLGALKVAPTFNVTISAYTDGRRASGHRLANERAKAIKDWLTAAGVAPSELHATTLVVPHQEDGRPHGLATVSVVLDELNCVPVGDGSP